MSLAQLLFLVLTFISRAAYVAADEMAIACASSPNHCFYTPAKTLRTGDATVKVNKGKLMVTKFDAIGQGTWLVQKGSSGTIYIQCQGSKTTEEFYFSDNQNGSFRLDSAGNNTDVAWVALVGQQRLYRGKSAESSVVGIDVNVFCPH